MNTSKNHRNLSQRDYEILWTIARYKLLTTPQVMSLFFPTGNYRTAARKFAALTQIGLLARVFSYPKVKRGERGHPVAFYFWPTPCQKKLKNYLAENGEASLWDQFRDEPGQAFFRYSFADLSQSTGKTEQFSQLYLSHEAGISDFFLALEAASAKPDAAARLVFWERTSPFSKDISQKLDADIPITTARGEASIKKIVSFNPDAFFCLQDQAGVFSFFFLEFDNNTATPEKYREKLAGYRAFHQQRRFPALLAHYEQNYRLGLHFTERAGFRVLTVTPDDHRRNRLFLDARKLKSYKLLLFASLPDITEDSALSSVWLRGKEYDPIALEEKTLAPGMRSVAKSQWFTEKLASMQRVSLQD